MSKAVKESPKAANVTKRFRGTYRSALVTFEFDLMAQNEEQVREYLLEALSSGQFTIEPVK